MQLFEVPYFDNTIKDISGRLIPENVLQDSKNILFDGKKIRKRYGVQSFANIVPTSINKISLYKQLYNDISHVVIFTTRDIFKLDSGKYKYLTRCFNHGTVVVTNGTTVTLTPPATVVIAIGTANTSTISKKINLANVTGLSVGMKISGTNIPSDCYISKIDAINKDVYLSEYTSAIPSGNISFVWNFDSTRWSAIGIYQIAFTNTDPDLVADADWKTVNSISGATTLLLSSAFTNGTYTSFCLRLCYSGDFDDVWQTAYPFDETMPYGGDKCILATNGIDFLQKWTGEGYFTDLYDYNNKCKHIGYWGGAGAEHIICSNVYDMGTGSWNNTAIEVSDSGEIMWDDGATYPLNDSTSPIMGVVPKDDRFVIYKKNTISIASVNFNDSNGSNPFSIMQDIKRNIGTISIDTVIDTGQVHLFFTGERIAFFDGYNHGYVDEGVYQYILKILNSTYAYRSFAFIMQDLKLYCLAIPTGDSEYCNLLVIYNYEDKNFTFWQFTDGDGDILPITAKGQYVLQYAPTWGDFLKTKTATASNSSTVTLNNVTGLEPLMRLEVNNIATELYIISVGASSVVVGTTSTNPPTNISQLTPHAITCSGETAMAGFTAEQQIQRWSDFLSEDNSIRMLLGNAEGYIYELGNSIVQDITGSDIQDVDSIIETKDFELNKGLTFLFLSLVIRAKLFETSTGYFSGSFDVEVSCDYGRTWTTPQTVLLDGNESFMEKKIAFFMRGKAIRIRLTSITGFVLENIFLEFNPVGKSMKYDY